MNQPKKTNTGIIWQKIVKVFPILVVALFFVLNVFTPLIADDFSYSFVFGTGERVSSISDIFISQYHHYMTWGGRNVAHFLTQLFLFIGNKHVFNIFNTLIYCFFILLIQFHACGSLKKKNSLFFIAINVMLWFLVPAWGQNFLWLTGSCNYLWMTTIVLFFLVPYRKRNADSVYRLNIPFSCLFFILGILTGWTNENSSAAVLFLLIAYFVLKIINKEKLCLFEITGSIGFLIGFYMQLSAPGNYVRLEVLESMATNQGGFIIKIIKRFVSVTRLFIRNHGLFLACFSAVLGFDILFYQKKKIQLFTWFYFLAGLAGTYSMLLSPAFPDRAYLIVTVFFCITVLNILTQTTIEIPAIVKRNLPIISIVFLIFLSYSFLSAGKNIVGVYLKWQERTQYILSQKEQGIMDIEVKAPIPVSNKHTSLYGLSDVMDEANAWPNTSIAQYFGIHSIKRLQGGNY
ncbi:MAG: DUF6056 family protein [Treponema sp.]|jgi:hypothetical protein|nr:DUF6056 family protein [Treponema sp.]